MANLSRAKLSRSLSKKLKKVLSRSPTKDTTEELDEIPKEIILDVSLCEGDTDATSPKKENTPMSELFPETFPVSDSSSNGSNSTEFEQEDAAKYEYGFQDNVNPPPEQPSSPVKDINNTSAVTTNPEMPSGDEKGNDDTHKTTSNNSLHLENSTKGENDSPPQEEQPKLQQVSAAPEYKPSEFVAFHPHRVPVQSSLKGGRIRYRRASIGCCTSQEFTTTTTKQPHNLQQEEDKRPILHVKLPGQRKVQRRRSITFNEQVNVRKVVPTKLLSDQPEKLWFQSQEYVIIKKKTQALLSKVDSNGFADGKKYCTRGLERYMVKGNEGEKYGALDSVLLEQKLQRGEGVFDEYSIARFYKQTSSRFAHDAAMLAMKDAEEVASFYATIERPLATQVFRRASMA